MEPELLTVSVSQLNHYIHRVIEHNGYLKDICIQGELSNCKQHPSGHIYMTLKDDASLLRAVMFRSAAQGLRFLPQDGMKVLARGRISVYEPGGTYQLYVETLTPDGEGALYAAYEQLKKKLETEGLFDRVYKKPIPTFPKVVSVVTASSGAAVRDILNILSRRWPLAEVKLFPVFVQGDGAAQQIADAIATLNQHKIGDVIIVGRGGGSIEDLWAFNEEVVARAIFASKIPVISAVGHETDFTIADFVADLRAPTPSAAAELAVPDRQDLLSRVLSCHNGLTMSMGYLLQEKRTKAERLASHPALSGFVDTLNERRITVDELQKNSRRALDGLLEKKQIELAMQIGKLDALSPLAAFARGYAYAAFDDETPIHSVKQLPKGTAFSLRLKDGTANCHSDGVQVDDVSKA